MRGKKVHTCEVCKREWRVTNWTTHPRPLLLQTSCSGQNPMSMEGISDGSQANTFEATIVCDDCQSTIARALATVILEIRAGQEMEVVSTEVTHDPVVLPEGITSEDAVVKIPEEERRAMTDEEERTHLPDADTFDLSSPLEQGYVIKHVNHYLSGVPLPNGSSTTKKLAEAQLFHTFSEAKKVTQGLRDSGQPCRIVHAKRVVGIWAEGQVTTGESLSEMSRVRNEQDEAFCRTEYGTDEEE